MPVCTECGGEFEHLVVSETLAAEVCEDCNPDFECDVCGDIIDRNDSVFCETRSRRVCPDCNVDELCPSCDEIFVEGSLRYSTTYGDNVCQECNEDQFCESCGESMHRDRAYFDDSGVPYCEGCYESGDDEDSCNSNYLHSYSYKPSPIFHWIEDGNKRQNHYSPRDTMFLGIEVEAKFKDSTEYDVEEARSRFDDPEDHVYHKEDSSLDHCSEDPGAGYESVSHPMTLEYFMQLDGYWNYIERMRRNGARGDTPKCGIHIHFSKTNMDRLHKSKFHLFFLVNKEYINRIARRYSKTYAAYTNRRETDLRSQISRSCARYSNVNWGNDSTGEVRVFKSTLNPDTIKAYLQFVDAVYWFTKKHILFECTSFDSWLNFYNWVKVQPKYAELTEYFNKKKDKLIPKKESITYHKDWFTFVTAATGKCYS